MPQANIAGARVLVTGGAGFIGSELVRRLVERDADVTVVDSLVNGDPRHIDDLFGDRCRLHRMDIRDADRMQRLLRDVDFVFHLACLGVRHSIHSPIENHEVNAAATLRLLAAAREAKVGRFIHISTSEVYGTGKYCPMTEEHPIVPNTIYGASKMAGECYARAYWLTYRFPTVVVRPFNNYGPHTHHEGDSGMVIPKFMLRCMAGKPMVIFGDGSQTRDFLYVTDTARGLIDAALCDSAVGQTFNLGLGSEIRIDDLAREVAAVVGRPDAEIQHDEPRPGDTLRLYSDTSRARAAFGFKAEVSLHEGLRRLHQWYLSLGRDPEDLLRDERVRNWEAVA